MSVADRVAAIDEFVRGCKSDGIWDSIKACCVMCGWDTLGSALIPLKGAAPTSYNFVSGDYSRTSGLVGDGSTKYLDSNYLDTDDPQNDCHLSAYISVASTASAGSLQTIAGGGSGLSFRSITEWYGFSGVFGIRASLRTSNSYAFADNGVTGLVGVARSAAGNDFDGYRESESVVVNGDQSGTAPTATTIGIYNTKFGASFISPERCSDARLSFYSIGEHLDLALLDARVSALMTNLGVS